jgi:hypothetical protein
MLHRDWRRSASAICSRARQQQASGVRKPMHDQGRDLDLLELNPHLNIGVDFERFRQHGQGVSMIILIIRSTSPGLVPK